MSSGRAQLYLDNLKWPGVATVAHLPSTVRPTGEYGDGLPYGVQFVAPHLNNRAGLAFAWLCDEVSGGFVAPPSFA